MSTAYINYRGTLGNSMVRREGERDNDRHLAASKSAPELLLEMGDQQVVLVAI